jgi:hypothetical protein
LISILGALPSLSKSPVRRLGNSSARSLIHVKPNSSNITLLVNNNKSPWLISRQGASLYCTTLSLIQPFFCICTCPERVGLEYFLTWIKLDTVKNDLKLDLITDGRRRMNLLPGTVEMVSRLGKATGC